MLTCDGLLHAGLQARLNGFQGWLQMGRIALHSGFQCVQGFLTRMYASRYISPKQIGSLGAGLVAMAWRAGINHPDGRIQGLLGIGAAAIVGERVLSGGGRIRT
jgi:hypothetical protein